MQHFALIKLIFKALNKMELRDEALQALRMFGASAYPHIEAALSDDERTDLCKKTLISFLWISEDIESKKDIQLEKAEEVLRNLIKNHQYCFISDSIDNSNVIERAFDKVVQIREFLLVDFNNGMIKSHDFFIHLCK